jgi:hypothetical protein
MVALASTFHPVLGVNFYLYGPNVSGRTCFAGYFSKFGELEFQRQLARLLSVLLSGLCAFWPLCLLFLATLASLPEEMIDRPLSTSIPVNHFSTSRRDNEHFSFCVITMMREGPYLLLVFFGPSLGLASGLCAFWHASLLAFVLSG